VEPEGRANKTSMAQRGGSREKRERKKGTNRNQLSRLLTA